MFNNKLKDKKAGLLVQSDFKLKRYKTIYWMFFALFVIVAIITVFPPLWILLSSFKESDELYGKNFTLFPETFDLSKPVDLWNYLKLEVAFVNSLIVVVGAVVCSVLFNGIFAYALAILKPVGHKIVFGIVLSSLMVPAIISMAPLYKQIVDFNLTNSFIPLWLVFGASPFYIIMFKTYFETLPKELFEAAEIDGASKLQVFRLILLPLSKPVVGVISIFTINAAWSDFLLPYLVLFQEQKQTLMVRIYRIQSLVGSGAGIGPDELLMILAISIIPPIILFFIFQAKITESQTNSGIK